MDVRPKQSASNTFSFEYHRQSNFLHSEIHPINKHVICSNFEKNESSPPSNLAVSLRDGGIPKEIKPFSHSYSIRIPKYLTRRAWATSGAVPPPCASAPRELHLGRLFVCPHWFNGYPVCQNVFSMGIQWVSNGYPKMEDQSIPPSSLMILFFYRKAHVLWAEKQLFPASRKFGKNMPDPWNIGNLPWITRKPFRIKNL